MKGDFGEIISASIEWTKTVLFRPFKFKKWVMLYIIALLAFQLQGGCSINYSGSSPAPKQPKEANQVERPQEAVSGNVPQGPVESVKSNFKPPALLITIIILIGIVLTAIFVVLEWIYSIFSFIFIGAIANNDASIKRPFIMNRPIGNSYFVWNIVYLIIFFGILATLIALGYNSLFRLGVFEKGSTIAFGRIALAILPHILIGVFLLLISALITFFVSNYVLVVMYKERTGILKALTPSFSIFRSDPGASIKYLFVNMGLWLATIIIGSGISFLIFIGLIGPIVSSGFILYGFYKVMPHAIQPAYVVILLILGIPLMVAFALLVNLIFLPFAVFLKTFNLKFISRLDDRYNLFRLSQ